MLTELYASRAAYARRQLSGFLADELADVTAHREVVDGDPAGKIVERAHETGVDAIVMPTHGYGTFRRFILGSITAKVLHDADVPVWTGVHMERAPDTGEIEFRSVVCGLDLGAHSARILQWAAQFAAACGARLTIVHAMKAIDPEALETYDPGWRKDFELEISEEIQRLQDRLATSAEVVVEAGDPPGVVCDVARDLRADLLVIGRSASEGVLGRLRAHAYSIIRQSPCPVLSI
jgi:nucleotide-binding universal stress UspA family protein